MAVNNSGLLQEAARAQGASKKQRDSLQSALSAEQRQLVVLEKADLMLMEGDKEADRQRDVALKMKEFRRMLEETKKEVRDIRSTEAQMKWNMAREEQNEKVVEEQAVDDEIRDWRWRQSDEMKEYVEAKEREAKVVELVDAKEFQEFKRVIKVVVKQEEQQLITEVYERDIEEAAWRAEQAMVVVEQDKEVILDRQEDVHHIKEVKFYHKLQQKAEADDARAEEQSREMANLARKLAREKEQLLESLELTRACQRVPVSSGRGSRPSAMGR